MSAALPHVRWPAERFYWAVLADPGVRRAGPLPEGLWPDLQDEVPVSAGPLHAVAAPAPGGKLVVCAATEEALVGIGEGTLSLTPEALPVCIGVAIDPASLNLLAGEHEPAAMRRVRTMRHLVAAAAVLACSLLLSFGLARRAAHWELNARAAEAARSELLHAATPPGTAESLRAELARAQASAGAAGLLKAPQDAAAAAAALLLAWPTAVPGEPQSLQVRGDTASVAVVLQGEAAEFLGAFEPPEGWTLLEPRLNAAGAGQVRLQLELRRRSEGTP